MTHQPPSWREVTQRRCARILVVSTLLIFAPGFTGEAAVPKVEEGDSLFAESTNIPTIRIELPPEAMRKLRNSRYEQDGTRSEVLGVVTDGTKTYTNVALHIKGSAGSSRAIDANPALTLTFDKEGVGQKFHGLTKLSLNNSVQDRSLIREKLCRELFAAVGVPTQRADYARVILNQRPLGLYVLLEGANKHFLRQHFEKADGVLYDGGYAQDINQKLTVTSGDKHADRADIRRLIAATRLNDTAKRFTELTRIIDMDRFIRMMAMEALIAHWDGYSQVHNNYRIYHDPKTDRLVFIPHGLDLAWWSREINKSLFPEMRSVVGGAVIETEEGRRQYVARVQEFAKAHFQVNDLLKRVDQIEARIRPVQNEDTERAVEELRSMVKYRCSLIAKSLPKLPALAHLAEPVAK